MKPTAVLLTVIMFVGASCITKDKADPITIGDNVLPEIPVKEEKAVPLPQTVYKQETKFKAVRSDVAEVPVSKVECHGLRLRDDDGVEPPPQVAKDSISINENDSNRIFTKVEIEAEYPGGAAAWQRFLNRNLRVPQEVIDNGLSGSVVVQFVVDFDGNVSNIEAVSGEEAMCAEIIRVIKKSGK